MKIIIFSDIHGNAHALKAVLTHIKSHHPDGATLVAAGDIALGGSQPAECVDLVRKSGALAVYGNTEEYIRAPHITPKDALHRDKWDRLLEDVHWTRSRLGADRINWISNLPFSIRIAPTPNPRDALLIFHGNPRSNEEMIYPSEAVQRKLWGEVRQPDHDPVLQNLFSDVTAGTVAFGHFHLTSTRQWGEKTLVNVASVSLPAYDKDPRAHYSVLTWRGTFWRVDKILVGYDYERELVALPQCGLPHWQDYAKHFPR